jgi:hypothetical protein
MQMSKNSPPLKLRHSKLRRSSIEGLRPVRVFKLKPSIKMVCHCCRDLAQADKQKLVPTACSNLSFVLCNLCCAQRLVGLTGLEPVTLRLSSACSNQLSYRPKIRYRPPSLKLTEDKSRWNRDLEVRGLEPLTYSLQSYRSTS